MSSPYGRLEIYWPEGPVENFILAKETVAIGRQTGNDLVLDRKGVSRYHVTLRSENGQVVLEDLESVNGVYIDSGRLASGEKRVLRGGEEIQIADVRMVIYIYDALDDTVPTEAQNTTYLENELVTANFNPPEMTAVPGADVKAALLLENLAHDSARYRIQIDGVPREWVRLDRTEVQLASGAQTEVLVSFKPARRSDTLPGNYPFSVIVEPVDRPESIIRIESQLKVGKYSGFGMVMATELIEGSTPFHLHVHNHGNAALAVSFRGVDPTSALAYSLSPRAVTLQAGERQTIEGTIQPQKGTLIGKAREYKYDVIALSHDSAGFQAAVGGRYVAKPMLPAWVATLAVPVVAIAAIGLIALLALLLGGGDEGDSDKIINPIIASFAASQAEVELGQPVELVWEVDNARAINISFARPNQPPQTIPVDDPTSNSYQLQLQTTGRYDITLMVENTGGVQTQLTSVKVKPHIVSFESTPQTLLQNITQNIEFRWKVEGAASLNGQPQIFLESSEIPNIQLNAVFAEGATSQAIFPPSAVSVTLRVVGEDGTENTRTLAIAVEEPRCLLSNPQANIHIGPNLNFDVVGTFRDIGTVVSPIVRNAENTWLQIIFNGQPVWVRVADFQCEGFDPSQLNVAVNIPATPTLQPTATATFTPTPIPPTIIPTTVVPRTPRPSATPRPQRTPG